ncbi:flagellar protein FlaG [Thiomicrorhabdus sediminis]|uniref:Flagellar protein FlaG n=1 Tax=Thiomicrorhabdus sediminis TaxID=2580412 RepID=A0A4P9K6I3_9GAMM|nr:flagellar protein FlaG [Thiomicrorhabdus sediminis]QCU90461.1 flagellar protein FlaG [Thiomicrorhabdus sediminis]
MDALNSLQPVNTANPSERSSTSVNDSKDKARQVEQVYSANQAVLERQPDATSTVNDSSQPLSDSDVDNVMSSLNEQLQTLQSYLLFEKDEDTEKMVFFIKNTETDEVLRQVPSQELLTISKNITDYLEMVNQSSRDTLPPVGLLTDQMA